MVLGITTTTYPGARAFESGGQLVVLAVFIGLTILATKRFHIEPMQAA